MNTTDTIRLSDRLELTPTLTPGWYVLRQRGAVVGANLPQSAADDLIAACNPPRYDLPPGVFRAADGTMVAQARTAVELGWEFKGTDGEAEDRWFKSGPLNHGAWVEVRPTPKTVPVPLHELTGRTFPGISEPIAHWDFDTQNEFGNAYWSGGHGRFTIDADGCVEVLLTDTER